MSEAFYSHARLYDLMFPGGGPAVDFYRAAAMAVVARFDVDTHHRRAHPVDNVDDRTGVGVQQGLIVRGDGSIVNILGFDSVEHL